MGAPADGPLRERRAGDPNAVEVVDLNDLVIADEVEVLSPGRLSAPPLRLPFEGTHDVGGVTGALILHGTAAQRNVPPRCTAETSSKSLGLIFRRVRSRMVPALSTRQWSPPKPHRRRRLDGRPRPGDGSVTAIWARRPLPGSTAPAIFAGPTVNGPRGRARARRSAARRPGRRRSRGQGSASDSGLAPHRAPRSRGSA